MYRRTTQTTIEVLFLALLLGACSADPSIATNDERYLTGTIPGSPALPIDVPGREGLRVLLEKDPLRIVVTFPDGERVVVWERNGVSDVKAITFAADIDELRVYQTGDVLAGAIPKMYLVRLNLNTGDLAKTAVPPEDWFAKENQFREYLRERKIEPER